MGIRHKSLPIEGVQYHPESIRSDDGMTQIANFLRLARGRNQAAEGPSLMTSLLNKVLSNVDLTSQEAEMMLDRLTSGAAT